MRILFWRMRIKYNLWRLECAEKRVLGFKVRHPKDLDMDTIDLITIVLIAVGCAAVILNGI